MVPDCRAKTKYKAAASRYALTGVQAAVQVAAPLGCQLKGRWGCCHMAATTTRQWQPPTTWQGTAPKVTAGSGATPSPTAPPLPPTCDTQKQWGQSTKVLEELCDECVCCNGGLVANILHEQSCPATLHLAMCQGREEKSTVKIQCAHWSTPSRRHQRNAA